MPIFFSSRPSPLTGADPLKRGSKALRRDLGVFGALPHGGERGGRAASHRTPQNRGEAPGTASTYDRVRVSDPAAHMTRSFSTCSGPPTRCAADSAALLTFTHSVLRDARWPRCVLGTNPDSARSSQALRDASIAIQHPSCSLRSLTPGDRALQR